MTVLSDKWIKKTAKQKGMIKPFVDKQVRKGKISFGLSSYGYDARVSNEFKIFTNVNSVFFLPLMKLTQLRFKLPLPFSITSTPSILYSVPRIPPPPRIIYREIQVKSGFNLSDCERSPVQALVSIT